MGLLRVLVALSLRNLVGHKAKNLIVGLIMCAGTAGVVLGSALLDSVEGSMQRSIVSSLAGHLQVYAGESKDELALFGSGFLGMDDIGRIEDFAAVKAVVEKVGNVRAIVPMGMNAVSFSVGNDLERELEKLRAALAAGDRGRAGVIVEKIRAMNAGQEEELGRMLAVTVDQAQTKKNIGFVREANAPAFWDGFIDRPGGTMEFLETRIAPLYEDGQNYFLRYLGTDLDRFAREFDRFKVLRGRMVPEGRRGFLMSDSWYEDQIKNPGARRLDKIHKEITRNGKTIARDELLKAKVREVKKQRRSLTRQLSPADARALAVALGRLLGDPSTALDALLLKFLELDDRTFPERYRYFYDVIAPKIRLYELAIGDTITLSSLTKAGYLKSVNLTIYGTFQFQGLEESIFAGDFCLMDMASFRDLYGVMTEEKRGELSGIRTEVGVKEIAQRDVEAALFGGGAKAAAAAAGEGFDEFSGADLSRAARARGGAGQDTITPAQIDHGLALNAAVILQDPARLVETRAAIERALAKAGMKLRVVDWKTASGIVGQIVTLLRGILYTALSIIFVVAIVIINNSMIMATMERVSEIGTIRAIGGRRRFVLALFLCETITLGMIAGSLGAAAGAAAVAALGATGIPAGHEILVFLFAGPRLFPAVGAGNVAFGFAVILLVSAISTLYPALLAARIQPVTAMQAKE